MDGETIGMIFISGAMIYGAIQLLAAVFRAAIKAMKAVGAFAVGLIPAVAAVYLSSAFVGVTEAQAAAQFVTTDVVVGAIGLAMFGE